MGKDVGWNPSGFNPSYKFWDSYQSDANHRDVTDIVLPLFLSLFLLEKERENGPICTVA